MATELRKTCDSLEFDEETGEILNREEFDKLDVPFEQKVEALIKIALEKKAKAEAQKEARDRLSKRYASTVGEYESLRNYIATCMVIAGKPKIKTDVATISAKCVRKAFINKKDHEGEIQDFLAKNAEFRKTKIELDEPKLKQYALSHEGDPEIAAFVEFKDVYTPIIR